MRNSVPELGKSWGNDSLQMDWMCVCVCVCVCMYILNNEYLRVSHDRLKTETSLSIVKNWMDFPGGSDSKASAHNAGDLGLIPGSGRSPGEGNGNPLQHSTEEHSLGLLNNPPREGVSP